MQRSLSFLVFMSLCFVLSACASQSAIQVQPDTKAPIDATAISTPATEIVEEPVAVSPVQTVTIAPTDAVAVPTPITEIVEEPLVEPVPMSLDADGFHVIGNPAAPIVMTEYSDYF